MTYSSAFRSPHLSELFSNGVHHGTNRYELGNSNLDIEKGHQFDFKYQWSSEHFGLVFNPFLQSIQDYLSIQPTENIINNNRVFEYTQFETVTISGLEMNLHYHPHFMHNLHLEQSYSIVETKNHDTNKYLALTPSNKTTSNKVLEINQDVDLFESAMNNDLNTPQALAILFGIVTKFDKLPKALLVPILIGDGMYL